MGYHTFINYGYGIDLHGLAITKDVKKIEKFLSLAPEYKKSIHQHFEDMGITEPTFDDYADVDSDFPALGFANVIKGVLEEISGLFITACENFDDHVFVMYQPDYPWNMSEAEKALSQDDIDNLFLKAKIVIEDLTEEDIDFVESENGG